MKMIKILAIVLLLLLVLIFAPFLTIWSLNTLFGLGIAYNLWTWLAMAWLGAVLSAKIGRKSA